MRRILSTVAMVALLSGAVAAPATAITDGALDGNGHPFVGLMVAQDADGTPLWFCSGTLISSKVFLTAGHCTGTPAAHVEIWFDADVQSGIPANGFPFVGDVGGTPFTHPQYDPNAFYLHDLGVVILDEDILLDLYGVLPREGQLDTLETKRGKQDVTFTAVGYGFQTAFPLPAQWKENNAFVRLVAHPKLIQINGGRLGDSSLLVSANASTGGTCIGDSGDPNFIGTSNVIGGVTSFSKNGNCAGTAGVYRVDRADDLEWLATFFD
jgi:hypothetical protein